MSDMPCIVDISLINEESKLKEDILSGKSLDILLILLSGARTVKEVSRELDLPSFSVQLYIKRLIEANLIKIVDTTITDGKIEKTYSLASTDIEILNHLGNNCKNADNSPNIELSAQHFASLTREVIRGIDTYKSKPHKIKVNFIKTDEATMENFKKDLDKLFEKYEALEDLNAPETYGFISVLAPYKL